MTIEKNDPMKFFGTEREARSALDRAYETMNSESANESQKLAALAEAMRAEASLEVLMGYQSGDTFWEDQYKAALALRTAYIRANAEANRAADIARREAYHKVMAEHFEALSDDTKEAMDVTLTDYGWDFTTSY